MGNAPSTCHHAAPDDRGHPWCDLIDAWPGHADGHGAIVAWLQEHHDVDGWWAQTVTVGWERITGRRLKHQQPDGRFTASKTRTVTADADLLRQMLLDEGDRGDLFPCIPTQLRSRPTSKNGRLAIGPGSSELALQPRGAAASRSRSPTRGCRRPDDVTTWKAWWSDWLEAIDEG